jgi:hypothetical protein
LDTTNAAINAARQAEHWCGQHQLLNILKRNSFTALGGSTPNSKGVQGVKG